MKNIVFCILISLFCFSCVKSPKIVQGLTPEYFDALDFSEIQTRGPQRIIEQGKIIKIGNYLFVNELKKGIHVIDNRDPSNPAYIYFWNIPGNTEFTINENYLYADNGPHLLVINISDYSKISFEKYIADVFFENLLEQFPDSPGVWFECAEPEKGLVKKWLLSTLEDPQCKTLNF